jgi:hypothetical protein
MRYKPEPGKKRAARSQAPTSRTMKKEIHSMKNQPIIVKFFSVMGLFGLFALGVAFYAT